MFDGLLKWDAENGQYAHIPESFRARCMNGIPWPSAAGGFGTASWVQISDGLGAVIAPEVPDDTYLGGGWYKIGRWASNAGEYLPYSVTVGLPTTAQPAAYSLFKGPVYKARSDLTNTLSATRIAGTGGSSDLVRLNWTTYGLVSGAAAMPLSHTLQYSTDRGVSWKYFTSPGAGHQKDISALYLPTGLPIDFRLMTTDGFSVVSSTASVPPLNVASKNSVSITEPRMGDNGPADGLWNLAANVAESATQVRWTSNHDGSLGAGANLSGVALSSGTHLLTCTATLADASTASDSISVVVGGLPDLQLGAGDLTFRPLGIDPVRGDWGWRIGHDNSINLKVRNSGTGGYWQLRMFLTPPGGSESLIGDYALHLDPFQEYNWSVLHKPTVRGNHHIRAEVVPDDPASPGIPKDAPPTTDADPSNNTLAIDVGNAAPVAWSQLVIVPAGATTSLVLNGSDPNDDPLEFSVTLAPAHGKLTGSAPNLTYQPDPGYNGPDKVQFIANDGLANSVPADVILRVGSFLGTSSGELPCTALSLTEISITGGETVQIPLPVSSHFPPADSVVVQNLPPGLVLSASLSAVTGTATQAGDFTVHIAGTNSNGTGPGANFVMHVLAPPGFKGWLMNYPELSETEKAPFADPDHDGVPNILEFAQGGDPRRTDKDRGVKQSQWTDTATNVKWARIHMPWSAAATNNVEWSAEFSTDMATWVKIGSDSGIGTSGYDLDNENYPDNRYLGTIGASVPVPDRKKLFLRFVIKMQ